MHFFICQIDKSQLYYLSPEFFYNSNKKRNKSFEVLIIEKFLAHEITSNNYKSITKHTNYNTKLHKNESKSNAAF